MTLFEAANHFRINKEKLQHYEENGLLDSHKRPDGSVDYCDETMDEVSLADLLLEAGLDMNTVTEYLGKLGENSAEKGAQIKILMKQRYALLDDIHDKEKILHCLDFVINEAKKKA